MGEARQGRDSSFVKDGLLPEYQTLDPEHRLEADLKDFEVVAEHFRNDFRMVWEHSSFFVLIQGAFLSVFAALSEEAGDTSVINGLAAIGIVMALVWWWAVTGRMRLVEEWRRAMRDIDARVDALGIFRGVEDAVHRHRYSDPTWVIARFLPPLIILSWIVLLVLQ